MTTPTTRPAATVPLTDDGLTLFLAWVQRYQKVLLTVFIVLVAGVLGYVYYLRSEAIKRERAEEALLRAMQAMGSGNLALAQSDLERVTTRFRGTSAATQAAMLLAQTYYEAGKAQDGIDRLTEIEPHASEAQKAGVIALIGDGYDVLGKHAEAAEQYVRAADAAEFPADKANYLAFAARHYGLAGNRQEAIRLWTQLAEDPNSPAAGEAKVRLGELTVQPAG